MELRRVDSFNAIRFGGEQIKILSPSVKQHDLVSVESTGQGIALFCGAGHVPLRFVLISPSDILAKKTSPRIGQGHTCRIKSNCRHSDSCCEGGLNLEGRPQN